MWVREGKNAKDAQKKRMMIKKKKENWEVAFSVDASRKENGSGFRILSLVRHERRPAPQPSAEPEKKHKK